MLWRTQVLVTRGEARGHHGAMDGSCSDGSGIEEDRACGGPGPTGGGPEQEDWGRIRADDIQRIYLNLTTKVFCQTGYGQRNRSDTSLTMFQMCANVMHLQEFMAVGMLGFAIWIRGQYCRNSA